MWGRSHGDWNRFLFSQILGAEWATMLLGSRHPHRFVLQSTWTTPEEMLPGGVAFAVTASPGTVGGAGCARRVGALRLHGEPAPTHLHRHAGRASSQVLARWAGVFSGLLLTPLAARPTALSRPRRAGLLLAL